MNSNKKLMIVLGALGSIATGVLIGAYHSATGEINPISAAKVYIEMKENGDQLTVEYVDKLFGPNGYANTDGKPGLSFREQADVRRRMGFGLFIEGESIFPYSPRFNRIPSLAELEKAVQSYEHRNQ